jgi:hypothetical protein
MSTHFISFRLWSGPEVGDGVAPPALPDEAGAPRRRRHPFGRPSCDGSPASIHEIKKHIRGF